MATVFKVANGVPCRACGAVRAAASSNDFGLCKNCWGGVVRHCGATVDLRRRAGHKPTEVCEEDVNSWLAHRLRLDVRRLSRDGIVGRPCGQV